MNDLELYIPTQINLANIILREKVAKKYTQLDATFRLLKHIIVLYII